MFTKVVAEYIGNFVESVILAGLLALLFEPHGITASNKNDGCILPHDADFETGGSRVIIAADMKSPPVGAKHIFVKMNADLIQRARG